jgi:hypothetical protein
MKKQKRQKVAETETEEGKGGEEGDISIVLQ